MENAVGDDQVDREPAASGVGMTSRGAGAPDSAVVDRLLREQAPDLLGQRVRPSPVSGSSNWVFRLGETHSVRLPRAQEYVDALVKEVTWLPRLGPELPVPVPAVELLGRPSATFPLPWEVLSWVPGERPAGLDDVRQARLADTLGRFTHQLHELDTTGAPTGSEHWGYRCGEPVTDTTDGWVTDAARHLADVFDPDRVHRTWQRLREVPTATGAACWVHTDLSAENILTHPDGRLAGVIDFGSVGVGDRSVDLLYAWSLFDAQARDRFRRAAEANDTTWLRARAWAFVGPGLRTIDSYRRLMPDRTSTLIHMVETIAAEVGVALR